MKMGQFQTDKKEIKAVLKNKDKIRVVTGIRKITKEVERSEGGICIISENYFPEDAFSHLPYLCKATGNAFYNDIGTNELHSLFLSETKKHSAYFIKKL